MQDYEAIYCVSAESTKLLHRQTPMHRDHINMTETFDKLLEIPQRETMKLPEVAGRVTEVFESDLQTADGCEND